VYKEYFHLTENPFSIAPDPRFLFMSERHCEAMAHLMYGVKGEGGIVLLTGEVGTGKTTICRSLIEVLPDGIDVAFVLNPKMNAVELLQTICEEFHIDVAHATPGIKAYIDALNTKLLANHALGHRAILIVDEAQNLSTEVLEQLRLLTNLETNTRKLLQIFLIGQPELQTMLSQPEMRQVSQRVVARFKLTHLNPSEVSTYVAHRLRIAGASPLIFPATLVNEIYRASGGVPRLINLICDRALLGTYVQGKEQVSRPILRHAIQEVLPPKRRMIGQRAVIAGISVLCAAAAIVIYTRLAGTDFSLAPTWLARMSSHTAPVPAATIIPDSQATPASAAVVTTPLQPPLWQDRSGSEPLAYQALFKLYGVDIDINSKTSPCQQAESLGMRCFDAQGGLSDLMQLDQPVLLKLLSAEGMEYAATLTALDHQTATLSVNGKEQHVLLSELAQSWFGLYVAAWRTPPGFNGLLGVSQRGTGVIWLRQTLSAIDGIPDNGSDFYDAALEKRVRAFQLADGIQPDGQVGPLTVIRLNVRHGNAVPRLVTEKKD
jgi:general secretion pathway protein A